MRGIVRHTAQDRGSCTTCQVSPLVTFWSYLRLKPGMNSNLISNHEVVQLLDEEMTEEEVKDLLDAEEVCKRFLEWDLDDREGVEVKEKLRWVLGISDEGSG